MTAAPRGPALRGIARRLSQNLVETPLWFEILGELAHRLDRLVQVAAIERREMPPSDADRIDEVLVAARETERVERLRGAGHRVAGSAVLTTRAGSIRSARTRLSGRGSFRRST
jgi:hypothetical protein